MQDNINELQRKIADIKSRLPAHSAKPAMLRELEELEEELEKLLEREADCHDDR